MSQYKLTLEKKVDDRGITVYTYFVFKDENCIDSLEYSTQMKEKEIVEHFEKKVEYYKDLSKKQSQGKLLPGKETIKEVEI